MRSGLERDFGVMLEHKLRAGAIAAWAYEPMSLRLAPGARYTPDFLVVNNDGTLTLFETKGFWREAGRVRIKVAADRFPWFEFIGVQKAHGSWQYEHFSHMQESEAHDSEADPQ